MMQVINENMHIRTSHIPKGIYQHITSVRMDAFKSWQEKGYEIIEESEDSYLIGKKKL